MSDAKCQFTWYADSSIDVGHGVSATEDPHRCAEVVDHSPTAHVCRCGAIKSYGEPIPSRIGRASVAVTEKGLGRVVVGLTDISNHVSGGTVEFCAGHPTVIKVEMPLVALAARGEIELDEETAKALEALGWVGPDEMLLRRRDLQEALGGLGTVLSEWDDLLGWVRRLVETSDLRRTQDDATLHKVAAALGMDSASEIKWSRVIERAAELKTEVALRLAEKDQ